MTARTRARIIKEPSLGVEDGFEDLFISIQFVD